jgi:hypothetical protein
LPHRPTSGVPGAFPNHPGPGPPPRAPRAELARVAPIRPEALQSREAGAPGGPDRGGPLAGLEASRLYPPNAAQPQALDDDGARATAEARAAVSAPAPPFAVGCTV